MVEFESDYLHIWIDEEINLMHSEWLRVVSSDEYRLGNCTFLTLLKKYSVKYWVVESSKLGDISEEDEKWTLTTLGPKIVQSGVIKLARVGDEKQVSYNKFNTFSEKAPAIHMGKVEIRHFPTFKEAADWMGSIRS